MKKILNLKMVIFFLAVIIIIGLFACTLPAGNGNDRITSSNTKKDNYESNGLSKTTIKINTSSIVDSFEVGMITVEQSSKTQWHTVSFSGTYTNPIVVMGPVSYNGGNPSTIRVKNIDNVNKTFKFQIDEWDYLDGKHLEETISYMVMEEGIHYYQGIKVEARKILSLKSDWKVINFQSAYDQIPVIIAQCVSYNGKDAVAVRMRNKSVSGFEIKLEEQESKRFGHNNAEEVSIIIFEKSTNNENFIISDENIHHDFKTISFNRNIPNPCVFANIQTYNGSDTCALRYRNLINTSCELKVEEEQSKDNEIEHSFESVGYAAIEAGIHYYPTGLYEPTNVTATYMEYPDKINVTWDPVENALEYKILISEEADGVYSVKGTSVTTSFDDFNIVHGRYYFYKVKAVCRTIQSNLSEYAFGCSTGIVDTEYKTVINQEEFSIYSDIAWNGNGNEYGIVWQNIKDGNQSIYFASVDESGNKIIDNKLISDLSNDSIIPSIVWTGSEYGVAWCSIKEGTNEKDNIYFARIDENGVPIGNIVQITDTEHDSIKPAIAWDGVNYGLVWLERFYEDYYDSEYNVVFSRISSDGIKIDEKIINSYYDDGNELYSSYLRNLDLDCNDNEYGILFCKKLHIEFTYINKYNTEIQGNIVIGKQQGYYEEVSITANGDSFGMAWSGNNNSNIFFDQIDSNHIHGNDLIICDLPYENTKPSITCNNEEYCIAWNNKRENYLYLSRVKFNGDIIAEGVQAINLVHSPALYPKVISNGQEFALFWSYWRSDIIFKELKFKP